MCISSRHIGKELGAKILRHMCRVTHLYHRHNYITSVTLSRSGSATSNLLLFEIVGSRGAVALKPAELVPHSTSPITCSLSALIHNIFYVHGVHIPAHPDCNPSAQLSQSRIVQHNPRPNSSSPPLQVPRSWYNSPASPDNPRSPYCYPGSQP